MKCFYCDHPLYNSTCRQHKHYVVGINDWFYWIAKGGCLIEVNFEMNRTTLSQYHPMDNTSWHRRLKRQFMHLSQDKWCYHHMMKEKILFRTYDLFDVNLDNFDSYVKKMIRLRAFA